MQLPSEQSRRSNNAFIGPSLVPKRTSGAASMARKSKPVVSSSTSSGHQPPRQHESVSTTTVDLNTGRNSERSRPNPEISFDQLIDAISFTSVERALNMYTLPSNHSWVDPSQHQPSRNVLYSTPSGRELSNAKRSSGSGTSCSSSQQPIKDDNSPLANSRPTTSSNRHHSQDALRSRNRLYDIESGKPTSSASLPNSESSTSPRFAAISSGIKRKNDPPANQTNNEHGKQEPKPIANGQQPKVASTELFLLPMPSSSNEDANKRMVVCSLSGMIDNAMGISDASRHLQVGVF